MLLRLVCVLPLAVSVAQAQTFEQDMTERLSRPFTGYTLGNAADYKSVLEKPVKKKVKKKVKGKLKEVTEMVTEPVPAPPSKLAGALVLAVQEGSAAATAGILPGDIILKANGTDVAAGKDLEFKTPPAGSPLELSGQRYLTAKSGRRYWGEFTATVVPDRIRDRVLAIMTTTVDPVTGVTRITNSASAKALSVTEVVPYISIEKKGAAPILYIRFQYGSDKWLFAERLTLRGKDKTHSVATTFSRDNSARIWEWAVLTADKTLLPVLHDMIESDAPIVRYHGENYFHDHKLSERERAILEFTLMAWYALTLPDPDKPRTP